MQKHWVTDKKGSRRYGSREAMQRKLGSVSDALVRAFAEQDFFAVRVYAQMAWHWALALDEG